MQCTISAGAGTPTMATLLQVKRRLVGYRADRRHAGLGLTSTAFLLVRIPRPVLRVYWPLVLGLRQAQRGRPTPLDVGAVPWPACGVDSLDGPPPGLPAGISAWSGNGMTGNGGPCVDTRRRVRACLLGRRVPNESSTADGRDGQGALLANGPVHGEQPPVERHARRGTGRQYRESLSTYCPGGTRAASTSVRRRPWKPREISGMPLRTGPMKEMVQRPFMGRDGARRSRRRPFG